MQKIKNNIVEYVRKKHKYIFTIGIILSMGGHGWTYLGFQFENKHADKFIETMSGKKIIIMSPADMESLRTDIVAQCLEEMEKQKEYLLVKIHESEMKWPISLMQHHLDGYRKPSRVEKEMSEWFESNWGIQIIFFEGVKASNYAREEMLRSMYSPYTYKTFINYKK